jgi:hypothetical protein
MFNFSPPGRGEPLDLTMMAQMAAYIDEVNTKIFEQKSAYSSLDAPVRLKVETDDLTMWTGKILVKRGIKPADPLERILWAAPFDITFKSVPVVTATPFCNSTGGGTISSNSVWLHEVTPNGCKGRFKFNEKPKQTEDVFVMIIAVGEGVV